jgi:hypothetical protein
MSEPDERTVMSWGEHDAHADDGPNVREDALAYGGEPDPPGDGWVYHYNEAKKRPVLNEDFYQHLVGQVNNLAERGVEIPAQSVFGILDGIMAELGFLAPPPETDKDTCEALWADPGGDWHQCAEDPGHDGEMHSDGEFDWRDNLPDAIPAPQYSTEPPF